MANWSWCHRQTWLHIVIEGNHFFGFGQNRRQTPIGSSHDHRHLCTHQLECCFDYLFVLGGDLNIGSHLSARWRWDCGPKGVALKPLVSSTSLLQQSCWWAKRPHNCSQNWPNLWQWYDKARGNFKFWNEQKRKTNVKEQLYFHTFHTLAKPVSGSAMLGDHWSKAWNFASLAWQCLCLIVQ